MTHAEALERAKSVFDGWVRLGIRPFDDARWMNRDDVALIVHPIAKAILDATRDEGRGMVESLVELTKPAKPAPLSYEARSEYACDVCGNVPDETGCLEHGKGCYTQSEDGGGTSYVEFGPPTPGASDAVSPRYCRACRNITPHRCHDAGHERDSSHDRAGCLVCEGRPAVNPVASFTLYPPG